MSLRDNPDMIRGRKAAEAVRAAGGSEMDATLAWIATTFDATAAERDRVRRAARKAALLSGIESEGALRFDNGIYCAIILPRRGQ